MIDPASRPIGRAQAKKIAEMLAQRVAAGAISRARAANTLMQIGHESVFGAGYGEENMNANQLGSINGVGPAGFFLWKDKSPGKEVEFRKFRKYHTLDQGLTDVLSFSNGAAVRALPLDATPLHHACALYRQGYYEGTRKDISDANGAGNISDYANALLAYQRFGEEAARPFQHSNLPAKYSVADALACWERLYPGRPVRRQPGVTDATLHAAPTASPHSFETVKALVSNPAVAASDAVLALYRLEPADRPQPGDFVCTYIGEGKYTPWQRVPPSLV